MSQSKELDLIRREKRLLKRERKLLERERRLLGKTTHKRKRKEKEKEKEPELPHERLPSEERTDDSGDDGEHRSVRRKKKEPRITGVTVRTKKGKSVTISDFSNRDNRVANDYLRAAVREGKEGGPHTDVMVDFLKQALSKGKRFEGNTNVPVDLLRRAHEELKVDLGRTAYDEAVNTDRDDENMVSQYKGVFKKYVVTDASWEDEGGYVVDMAAGRPHVAKVMRSNLDKWAAYRVYINYRVVMAMVSARVLPRVEGVDRLDREVVQERTVCFTSAGAYGRFEAVRKAGDIEGAIDAMYARILQHIDEYTERASGMAFLRSLGIEVFISKLRPPKQVTNQAPVVVSAVAGKWKPLPKWLRNLQVCNPKPPQPASDEKCFAWCILRGIYGLEGADPNRTGDCRGLVPHIDEIRLPNGVGYPLPLLDKVFKRIEEANDFSFSVMLLGTSVRVSKMGRVTNPVSPFYSSSYRGKKARHFVLGLLGGDHFVLIKKLESVVRAGRISTHYFCENCLSGHKTRERMEEHYDMCRNEHEPTKVTMPMPGGYGEEIRYKSWSQRIRAPFVIYADIEALLVDPKKNDDSLSVHKPVSWCYYIKCAYKGHEDVLGWGGQPLNEVREYCGNEAMTHMITAMHEDTQILTQLANVHVPYVPHEGDTEEYRGASRCWVCHKGGFTAEVGSDKEKVLDHDHMDGRFRGAAHRACNVAVSVSKNYKVPIFFHNLRGYDSYHIIRGLEGCTEELEKIHVIAKSMDSFTSFSIDNMRFVNSCEFIKGSLADNANTVIGKMARDDMPTKLGDLLSVFDIDIETPLGETQLAMVLEKGIYPYEYMKNMDSLKRQGLPKIDCFWSDLSSKGITEEEYARANIMYEAWHCRVGRAPS